MLPLVVNERVEAEQQIPLSDRIWTWIENVLEFCSWLVETAEFLVNLFKLVFLIWYGSKLVYHMIILFLALASLQKTLRDELNGTDCMVNETLL